MQPQTDPPAHSARSRTILGHPVGLYVLFLTQMWERFSFFGMLALLILYLNEYHKLSQESASYIFKWYTSAVYFTPLVGGYLADRVLGNKKAVVLGAGLMAVGHFLMAFPPLPTLYLALLFLVVGCGLLTPPLTTQVGLLYPPGDPRRDSAYTIFYMGINLGAFASPLLCGWLAENTVGGYHSGFTVAGLGMVAALVIYLVGLRWVAEVDQKPAAASPPDFPDERITERPTSAPIMGIPALWPTFSGWIPRLLTGLGAIFAVAALAGFAAYVAGFISLDAFITLGLAAACLLMFAWITTSVWGGLRDRVLAILLLGAFSIFYWAGAGQYGNAINLWAEQNTDRYLTGTPPTPDLYPAAAESGGEAAENAASPGWERWTNLFKLRPKKPDDTTTDWLSPIPTAWFQSVNPLLILILAPVFAFLWTWLARWGLNPSIPVKMGLGLLLMALAFAVMLAAGSRESRSTAVQYLHSSLPPPLTVNEQHQVCRAGGEPHAAGRLYFEESSSAVWNLRVVGVFPDLVRDEVVRDTAPADFAAKLEELQKKTVAAAKGPTGWSASVQLVREPPGIDLRYAGFGTETGNKDVRYDPATRTLTATIVLEEKEIKGLKTAAGDSAFRSALDRLMIQANASRVSPWWLIGFFLLATLGELCLSPVGLSMVSQLAPARFATMLMGLWLLTFAFGNFLAGGFGEKWGTWSPVTYFLVVTAVLGAVALLLFAMSRKIGSLMHEGK